MICTTARLGGEFVRNSDKFLISYNKIEAHLKSILGTDDYVPFVRSVELIVKKNLSPIIKRYRDDLIEFAELRNAIVHKTIDPNHAIAEPHDYVVDAICEIEKELLTPKKVIPMFARSVHTCEVTDLLSDLLKTIREKEYSQFPVYDRGKFKGLITRKGITKWLAKQVETNNQLSVDVPLYDVLISESNRSNFEFISEDVSIYEAKDKFLTYLNFGKRLDTLLITATGKQDEPLLGMITPLDLVVVP